MQRLRGQQQSTAAPPSSAHKMRDVFCATNPVALSGQVGHCSASCSMRPSGLHVTPVHKHTGTLLSATQPLMLLAAAYSFQLVMAFFCASKRVSAA